jgi:hypothetical protein
MIRRHQSVNTRLYAVANISVFFSCTNLLFAGSENYL